MDIFVAESANSMGCEAARAAAERLAHTISSCGEARLLVATGASQFSVLEHLIDHSEIDWSKVDGFHLDEYIGIASDHPASFCKYLKERFVDRVPLRSFHYLHGDRDPHETVRDASAAIAAAPIDVALVGIGENAHLAFNDPPADFATTDPYLIVQLDEACRQQQVGEGWFDSLATVPEQAISMSIAQILKSREIICSVPDRRKASAVKASVEGEISPLVPASSLRKHPGVKLLIDHAAASELSAETLAQARRITL